MRRARITHSDQTSKSQVQEVRSLPGPQISQAQEVRSLPRSGAGVGVGRLRGISKIQKINRRGHELAESNIN